ncbi:MAG: demethoxyubiquinone hydroxylase family protein [Hyphomicrobiaceae bacterium]|nr:demethoxyubiquinone hydroxylase family protein [Hyphomicrobiaceae bacterium]
MYYRDSTSKVDTAKKILKVNHAGEFGAINIYRAQIFVSRFFRRDYVSLLENFLADEYKHLDIFWTEIQRRKGIKCKSYWLCGAGGWCLGFVSALMGKTGIMSCTWAVESVVTEHLEHQLVYLKSIGDHRAVDAVQAILEDEQHHRDVGQKEGGADAFLYIPFRWSVSFFTKSVIVFGMR